MKYKTILEINLTGVYPSDIHWADHCALMYAVFEMSVFYPLNSIEMSEKLAVKYIEKSDWHVLCPAIDMFKRSTYHMNNGRRDIRDHRFPRAL